MIDKRECPDDGACHHHCTTRCWRVDHCEPLTGVYPGDRWPVELFIRPQPQRQDALADQLEDLHRAAARLGMYDAADWLWRKMHS